MQATGSRGGSRSGLLRGVGFRIAAILLGLSPFLLAEGGLRLAAWRPPIAWEDPYVGFASNSPLFVLNRERHRYEIAASRLRYFRPDSFAARKGAGEFRIFCLGGSTVQGNPWAIETSFTSWLELSLKAADPERDWVVVNCGGISYASYRLVPMLHELLAYEPDLFILYTGQNEFLEDRSYRHIKQTPRWAIALHGWFSRSRLYEWIRTQQLRLGTPRHRSVLAGEVDAMLDYRGGLNDYRRDDLWREGVVEHFGYNLDKMVQMAQAQGIPVLLADPVCNLKDCPPFKYEWSADLSAEQKAVAERRWTEARQLESDRLDDEIDLIREALDLDPRHAGLRYHLGKCLEAQSRWDEARAEFERARDEDICPLRVLGVMHAILRDVAQKNRVPLVEIDQRISSHSPGGIPGREWMVDHVHPTIRGYQELGDAFFETMVQQGWVNPRPGWQDRRKQLFQERLDSLDTSYFARAQEHLVGLRRWSQGRAPKIRPRPLRAEP